MNKFHLKKVFCLILSCSLLCAMVVPAHADNVDTVTEAYIDFASDVVEQYYLNKDLDKTNDLSAVVTDEVETLLNAKIEMGKTQRDALDLTYADYDITILPFAKETWSITDDEISLSLQVIRTWFYTEVETTVSEVIDVTLAVTDSGFVVTECYDRYDSLTLGPIDRLYQEELAAISTYSTVSTVDNFVESYIQDFESQCIDKKEQLETVSLSIDATDKFEMQDTTRSSTTLSRSSIASWARSNYNKSAPSSGGSSVPYVDFGSSNTYYDYTNFTSHALLAGGATLNSSAASGITGSSFWYFRSSANRSNSWVSGNHLKSFLTRSSPSSSSVGPYGTVKTFNYTNTYAGDIIQGYDGSAYTYTLVATYFSDNKVYATGRAAYGSYYNNVDALDLWGTMRLIHLEGNYN